jgi:hypothetical protein
VTSTDKYALANPSKGDVDQPATTVIIVTPVPSPDKTATPSLIMTAAAGHLAGNMLGVFLSAAILMVVVI